MVKQHFVQQYNLVGLYKGDLTANNTSVFITANSYLSFLNKKVFLPIFHTNIWQKENVYQT